MTYNTWLVLHILGVVIFLGNITVTAVWKVLADRTRNPAVVGYAQRLVTVTDIAFTATGAALIAVSGQMMAGRFGGIGGAGWLTLGFALFIASGVIWITTLIPIQIMQARLARRFARDGAIPDRYWRLAALWYVLDMPTPLFPSDHTASTTTAPGRSARSRKRASTSRCNTWEATHLFRPRTYLDPDNVLVAQRKARGNLVDRVAHAGASPARDLRSLYC